MHFCCVFYSQFCYKQSDASKFIFIHKCNWVIAQNPQERKLMTSNQDLG